MTDTLLTDLPTPPAATRDRRAEPVAVLGTGLLATAIARALADAYHVQSFLDDRVALVVAADTSGSIGHRAPWLPVEVEAGWIVLGPAVLPGQPGCPTCAQRRRQANRTDAKGHQALQQAYGAELAQRPSVLLIPLTAVMTAAVALEEVTRLLQTPESARTRTALLRLSLTTGQTHHHPVLPDPLCPDCARLPDDSPHTAAITLRPTPKPGSDSYRTRELVGLLPALRHHYVDPLTGVIQSVGASVRGGYPVAVARLQPATRDGDDTGSGYGRSTDLAAAQATALTEALERLSGPQPRGRRTTVRAAFTELADQALDPVRLGLYPPARHDTPGFAFRRYDPTQPRDWVWGYSFARATPILVPRSYAYYGRHEEAFVYECSNGCALGGCLAEAILYGLLEVTERDAFLMTWYARLPAPRVDLAAAADRRIPLLAEWIRRRLGYHVLAFETTLESGIPSYWVMAVDQRPALGRMHALCRAAAHLDPERALRCALSELAPAVAGEQSRYDPDQALRLLTDPDQVREMHHHATLYGHPDAFPRLGFLPLTGPARPPGTSPATRPWPAHDDLAADLTTAIGRYLTSGLDVIVIDHTSPEHASGGFRCVKVVIPGTLSMTFGHRYRRTDGLPRLHSVPRLLGYRDRELRPEEINPHPHPFP
jgi:ribosomal protein S12 methylthiotransferase accessory factor